MQNDNRLNKNIIVHTSVLNLLNIMILIYLQKYGIFLFGTLNLVINFVINNL